MKLVWNSWSNPTISQIEHLNNLADDSGSEDENEVDIERSQWRLHQRLIADIIKLFN